MSELLQKMLDASRPVAKSVTFAGVTGEFHFKRLTQAQKAKLIGGQKVTSKGGEAVIELDLSANERQKAQLVHMTACDPDGAPLFKSLAEVEGLASGLVGALAKASQAVNADEEDLGKS